MSFLIVFLTSIKIETNNRINKAMFITSKYWRFLLDNSKKLLLNQENVATFERTLTYYSYLNKARLTQLDNLKITLIQLEEKQNELTQTQAKMLSLIAEQKQKRKSLLIAKNQRKGNLALLKN